MRPVRPSSLITACLCLAILLSSCGSPAKSTIQPAVSSLATPGPLETKGTPPVPASVTSGNKYYTVDFGDSLSTIAERFGVTVSSLAGLNHITDLNAIKVGQRLLLPGGAVESTAVPQSIDGLQVPILLYHHIALLSPELRQRVGGYHRRAGGL